MKDKVRLGFLKHSILNFISNCVKLKSDVSFHNVVYTHLLRHLIVYIMETSEWIVFREHAIVNS